MAGGGAEAAGELPEGGFLKAARLIYSNQSEKTPAPARRRKRMTIKAYQRSSLLGADVSTRDFVLSQGSGNAALCIWMAANAVWAARQRKKQNNIYLETGD